MRKAPHQPGGKASASRRQGDPAPKPAREKAERLDQLLKRHWKRYRKQLKKAQEHFSEDAVHQSRIEARRLLAVIELMQGYLFAPAAVKFARALKGHLDLSDGLRDTQVQLLIIKQLEGKEPALRRFRAYLRKREQRLKERTRKAIHGLKTGRVEKWVDECRDELREADRRLRVPGIPKKLLGPVRQVFARTRSLCRNIDPEDPSTIHRTRVSFKKFRYMAEALDRFEPGISPAFLDALRAYQGLMGDIQDWEVLLASFDRWFSKKLPDPDWALAMRAELMAGRDNRIRTYLAESRKLLDFWPLPHVRFRPKPKIATGHRRTP